MVFDDRDGAPLAGLRVIEVSSFVAAPLGGMTLAQLGAEVIRIDPPGGAPDTTRWPLAPNGGSLYWAGLNKGKRSVTLDLRSPGGQRAAASPVAPRPSPRSSRRSARTSPATATATRTAR
jgi:2-methylfumaryl-CoA isomerase